MLNQFVKFFLFISLINIFVNSQKNGTIKYHISVDYQTNWYRAFHYCKYHNMDLVSIESDEEKNSIQSAIFAFDYFDKTFWTAGTDLGSENNFYWVTNGRPMNYVRWAQGEPSGMKHPNDNCVAIFNQGIFFTDQNCNINNHFICQSKDPTSQNDVSRRRGKDNRLIFV